jgi:transcription-repair coupling factor (superfamily II helicase)
VRGGILDVFPPTEEHPVRVEWWGDSVEEVRSFKVADQRSLQQVGHGLWAPPCRELLLTPEVRARAKELAATHPELAEICTKIADGHPVEGMEALAPVLVDGLRLLVDELPPSTSVVVCDPEKVRTRAHDLVRTSQEFLEASWATAAVGGAAPIDLGAAAYRTLVEVREHAGTLGLPWWSLSPFTADEDLDDDAVVLAAQPPPAYRGEIERAVADLRDWTSAGWRVVVTTEGHGPGPAAARAAQGRRSACPTGRLVRRARRGAARGRLPGDRVPQRPAAHRAADRERPDRHAGDRQQGRQQAHAEPPQERGRPGAAAHR